MRINTTLLAVAGAVLLVVTLISAIVTVAKGSLPLAAVTIADAILAHACITASSG
jgi:hypothetical protein